MGPLFTCVDHTDGHHQFLISPSNSAFLVLYILMSHCPMCSYLKTSINEWLVQVTLICSWACELHCTDPTWQSRYSSCLMASTHGSSYVSWLILRRFVYPWRWLDPGLWLMPFFPTSNPIMVNSIPSWILPWALWMLSSSVCLPKCTCHAHAHPSCEPHPKCLGCHRIDCALIALESWVWATLFFWFAI